MTNAEIEEVAVEAIGKVEQVADRERLVPDGVVATPDWRLTLGDGRVADVEVIRCIAPAATALFSEAHHKDGSPKEWHSEKLSHRWGAALSDRDPAYNRNQRSFKQAKTLVTETLVKVEAQGGTPEEMHANAKIALGELQIGTGSHSQRLAIGDRAPKWVGPGKGSLALTTLTARGYGLKELASDVQDAVDRKVEKDQMVNAPDLKWLAVVADAWVLDDYYGPRSRYHKKQTAGVPKLRVTFGYFNEVWVCSLSGPVVLRLSDGGAHTTVHHV